ncbi:hypothetical protein MB901379_03150 [Mycobacterium basiliense]|uniref:Cupin type-2 domain-containing protein n=2 Tax=Mycobacterium basiliense TaxID=2094119 RepID=A0A447GGH7_9MYCO|nr:cupin domain-containing protein [Mycobacterium basiliense]VDM89572.1 hypothetical protein MB901379_03150 [Mycobacterium basiliense]
MFVSSVREAVPFVAADLSEIRLLADRTNVGITSVSLAHATVAVGEETVWHRLTATDEIYFILSGRGLVMVEDEAREVRAGDAVWIPAGVPQKIRNLGRIPLAFLCACGPAYAPECDQPTKPPLMIPSRRPAHTASSDDSAPRIATPSVGAHVSRSTRCRRASSGSRTTTGSVRARISIAFGPLRFRSGHRQCADVDRYQP